MKSYINTVTVEYCDGWSFIYHKKYSYSKALIPRLGEHVMFDIRIYDEVLMNEITSEPIYIVKQIVNYPDSNLIRVYIELDWNIYSYEPEGRRIYKDLLKKIV
jgi:hypothetical protein